MFTFHSILIIRISYLICKEIFAEREDKIIETNGLVRVLPICSKNTSHHLQIVLRGDCMCWEDTGVCCQRYDWLVTVYRISA